MKIYAMCVVKNEADIIAFTLKSASHWADKIIVFDNGSTDETWDVVKSIPDPKVIPFKQETVPYSDGLRAVIFDAYKSELEDGDWWVILDADEVYDESPRDFLQRQTSYFHHVNGKKIDFCFDLSKLDQLQFTNDFTNDVKFVDHYTPIAWSEPRAIKHRKKLQWSVQGIWPRPMGLVCPNAINIRHYPLRSRDQIKKRWDTRKSNREAGGQSFSHWEKSDWRDYYLNKSKDQKRIKPGENVFESVGFANEYRQGFLKRVVKNLLHRSGVLPSVLSLIFGRTAFQDFPLFYFFICVIELQTS
jgi:glycosyltransferase involved in cell wall biosynthesis